MTLPPPNERWYGVNINPEPWAVGPLDIMRRGGKIVPTYGRNQQLHMYQEALRDEIKRTYPPHMQEILRPGYELDFWFWRNTEKGNVADATNLQKATEDALQGLLLQNDREVVRVASTIVEQGPDVYGTVIFRVRWCVENSDLTDPIPVFLLADRDQAMDYVSAPPVNNNVWPPR